MNRKVLSSLIISNYSFCDIKSNQIVKFVETNDRNKELI